jgi:hypothetical protein
MRRQAEMTAAMHQAWHEKQEAEERRREQRELENKEVGAPTQARGGCLYACHSSARPALRRRGAMRRAGRPASAHSARVSLGGAHPACPPPAPHQNSCRPSGPRAARR